MICEVCRGHKSVPGLWGDVPCPDCNGSGIASCCDAAGSALSDAVAHGVGFTMGGKHLPYEDVIAPSFTCERCGAVSYNPNDIREGYCGACHRFKIEQGYRDDTFLPRKCDHCGKQYQGPAVYCSLECAIADA